MNRSNKHSLYGIFLILSILISFFWPGLASAADLNAETVRWSKLGYSASKFLITVNSEVNFQRLEGEAGRGELSSVPEGEAKDSGSDPIVKLSLVTSLLGRQSMIDVWMKPDATVLQRTTLSTGGKQRYKLQRYMPQGAFSIRRRPGDKSEEKNDLSGWSNVSERYYTIPEAEQELPLTEAEGLFYLVAAANIAKPGDTMKVYLFDEEGTLELHLAAAELEQIKVSFIESKAGKETKVSGKMDTLKIHASATRYADQTADANFQFLGCKGDIDLYLDLERRVIVQVSGQVEYMGTVNIRLKELVMATEPVAEVALTP